MKYISTFEIQKNKERRGKMVLLQQTFKQESLLFEIKKNTEKITWIYNLFFVVVNLVLKIAIKTNIKVFPVSVA